MRPEHIVFVLSDQHNPNVAGFAADTVVRTPNFDRLSNSGVTFDNCYCSSPLCVPSRASMLSAQLPSKTGVLNNFQALPSHMSTFARSLSIAGFETVLCGRMHFNGPDQRLGFEKRLIGDLTPSLPGLPKDVYGDALKAADFPGRAPIEKAGPGYSSVLQYDSDVTEAAIEYMSTRTDPRPLFMVVGYYGPHCPYVAPPDLYAYYKHCLPPAEEISSEFRRTVHPAIRKWYKNRDVENVSAEQISRVRAAYYGMVEFLDNLFGQVAGGVERNLGIDDTLLIYGSDHGDTLGENGVFWKTNFYEGAARVPLVCSWPAAIPITRHIQHPVSLMDVGPTLIDIAEGPQTPGSDGLSLKQVLLGSEEADPDRTVFSQLADVKGDNPSAMVRKRQWKLVSHIGYKQPQLFNLEEDPTEKNDLGDDHEHHSVREELLTELGSVWDETEIVRLHKESAEHARLYKEWVRVVGAKGIESDEWYGEVARNYLVPEE